MIHRMDNIIKQILEIDAKAQEKLECARAERDAMKVQVDQEAQRAAEKLREECEARIQKIYDREKDAADKEVTEIRSDTEKRQSALEALFAENHAAWAEEVAEAVLNA